MRILRLVLVFVFCVFVVPSAATAGWWMLQDRPGSWSSADWSASGVLPKADADDEAAVYLMAARTGGLKGAVAVHTWIVLKRPGAGTYDRYDKVGWGMPVRHNRYPADGLWYSNRPRIVHAVHGAQAAALVPEFEAAIRRYPYSHRGDYRIWPGPNSNTFTAWLLRKVPAFGGAMPSNAVGRDYAPGLFAIDHSADWLDVHATLGGLAGFAIGVHSGIEVHFAGLVAGIDVARPALKIPAYGRVALF